jgi:hypothetical protein
MSQGDDGFFVTAADPEAAVWGTEPALGASGGMGTFVQDRADRGVAFAGLTALALAADSGWPGQSAAQEARRSAELKWERPSPLSIRIGAAPTRSMPRSVCHKRQAPS